MVYRGDFVEYLLSPNNHVHPQVPCRIYVERSNDGRLCMSGSILHFSTFSPSMRSFVGPCLDTVALQSSTPSQPPPCPNITDSRTADTSSRTSNSSGTDLSLPPPSSSSMKRTREAELPDAETRFDSPEAPLIVSRDQVLPLLSPCLSPTESNTAGRSSSDRLNLTNTDPASDQASGLPMKKPLSGNFRTNALCSNGTDAHTSVRAPRVESDIPVTFPSYVTSCSQRSCSSPIKKFRTAGTQNVVSSSSRPNVSSESSEDHSVLLSPLCTLISEGNMAIRLSSDEALPFPMTETGVENSQETESNSIDRPDECSGHTQNPSSLVSPPCTSLAENSTALEPSISVASVQDNCAQRSSNPSKKKSTLVEITGIQPCASIQVSSNSSAIRLSSIFLTLRSCFPGQHSRQPLVWST